MPNLNFVLPHWLYWGALLVFPAVAMFLVARQKRLGEPRRPSLFVAYLFWICAGMWGLHRFYLRSLLGLVYFPIFIGILYCNDVVRDRREDVSRTHSAFDSAHRAATRLRPNPGVTPTPQVAVRIQAAEAKEKQTKSDLDAATGQHDRWSNISRWIAILLVGMLLVDAVLLPGLVKRTAAREAANQAQAPPDPPMPNIPPIGTNEDPTLAVHTRITDVIDAFNTKIGEYTAYWAIIAVFVYYYEVLARYVFNSPTNWVHESMFLMFGMQYMLSGAYAYREDQHVRVDVIYTQFSPRGKAIADIITSVFFFIFVITMLLTGWRFASDALGNNEVSFTEWGIQYWPVKLTIPIGAALLALQGVSKLIKDIVIVTQGERVSHGA
jgi:TRAP-type mannitol/chloroaromatic compound transport system permease small subunit